MAVDGEIVKPERGKYALPTKIDKKERPDAQPVETAEQNSALTDLTNLTGECSPSNRVSR
jgi:hypothetical protein